MSDKCQLAEVSRAGYYRSFREQQPDEEELHLLDCLQKLVTQTKQRRGYRPLTMMLKREGHDVNHKRVLRLMREDNLLCLRSKKFVFSGDLEQERRIFMNLARGLKVTGLNQLWAADITFIRLRAEFIYLAVVLDAHSRRVIGWSLSRTLEKELPLAALRQAMQERDWKNSGLVHHSDRGSQYASNTYTELLEANGIGISMSRAGNPYDNARVERFMRTVKEEEVRLTEYRDLEDAQQRIGDFLRNVYNEQRLHSALKYQTPAEFESALEAKRAVEAGGIVETGENRETRFPHRSHNPLEIPAGISTAPTAPAATIIDL